MGIYRGAGACIQMCFNISGAEQNAEIGLNVVPT